LFKRRRRDIERFDLDGIDIHVEYEFHQFDRRNDIDGDRAPASARQYSYDRRLERGWRQFDDYVERHDRFHDDDERHYDVGNDHKRHDHIWYNNIRHHDFGNDDQHDRHHDFNDGDHVHDGHIRSASAPDLVSSPFVNVIAPFASVVKGAVSLLGGERDWD
jgi:hypothetical protein